MSNCFEKTRWTTYLSSILHDLETKYIDLPVDHPIHIALRTYALSLSLSLGPALIPLLTSKSSKKGHARVKSVLRRELGITGFAFAMTIAVGGGAALDTAWRWMEEQEDSARTPYSPITRLIKLTYRFSIWLGSPQLRPSQKTFIANILSSLVAISLLHSRRRSSQTYKANIPLTVPISKPCKNSDGSLSGKSSATLDLTLLFVVRALDSVVQGLCLQKVDPQLDVKVADFKGSAEIRQNKRARITLLTTRVDALIFWAASARIMWCFFYHPERLPQSYVKWITSLANMDPRLLETLRRCRDGQWSYTKGSAQHHSLLTSMARDLGYPPSWGDPNTLPAFGGPIADKVWEDLGVKGRNGRGGVPCEIVHGEIGKAFGGVGGSCTGNALLRGASGFLQALLIYAPVHLLPVIVTHPRALFSLPRLRKTTTSLLRSSLFLSTFISSIWYTVCLTRTLLLARLFPKISHDIYDGYGCILAGCLACGGSIWIENGRRRGEMALYVLPRALRTSLSDAWVRSGSASVRIVERLTFILSLSAILTASVYRPETLRGLSRWTLDFVMKGPEAAFWKRKQETKVIPDT